MRSLLIASAILAFAAAKPAVAEDSNETITLMGTLPEAAMPLSPTKCSVTSSPPQTVPGQKTSRFITVVFACANPYQYSLDKGAWLAANPGLTPRIETMMAVPMPGSRTDLTQRQHPVVTAVFYGLLTVEKEKS